MIKSRILTQSLIYRSKQRKLICPGLISRQSMTTIFTYTIRNWLEINPQQKVIFWFQWDIVLKWSIQFFNLLTNKTSPSLSDAVSLSVCILASDPVNDAYDDVFSVSVVKTLSDWTVVLLSLIIGFFGVSFFLILSVFRDTQV